MLYHRRSWNFFNSLCEKKICLRLHNYFLTHISKKNFKLQLIKTSHDEIDSLKSFFRNEPLNKIAISRAFHELWKRNDIQSEENDCNRLLAILNELMAENLDSDRKRHLISLQDIDKVHATTKLFFL